MIATTAYGKRETLRHSITRYNHHLPVLAFYREAATRDTLISGGSFYRSRPRLPPAACRWHMPRSFTGDKRA